VDLLPTFLDWFDLESPDYLEGKSLMPILRGEETHHRTAYMEFPLGRKVAFAFFDGRYKYIEDQVEYLSYMYDLHLDPEERQGLGDEHPAFEEVRAALGRYLNGRKKLIETLGSDDRNGAQTVFSEEDENVLRNLGYID